MIDTLRKYFKPKYKTLNNIYIDKKKFLFNLNLLKSQHPKSELIPVLKANAYGHGLKIICQILKKTSTKTVAVDSFPEAQIASKYFGKNILIISEMPLDAYSYCDLKKTEFCIYNEKTLKFLAKKYGKSIKIHLFFNTGMNREGVKKAQEYIRKNKESLQKVSLVGACSHLLASEQGLDSEINSKQERKFQEIIGLLKSEGFSNLKTHLGNSGGIFSLKNNYSAYRAGISLYGYNVLSKDHEKFSQAEKLKPCLSLESTISSIQELVTGEKVSYSFSYQAKNPTLIAVIPFGYFEGLSRHLSNKALFKIKAQNKEIWGKIAGSVCMNLSCLELNLQEKDNLEIGDKVEIISTNKADKNSVENLAKQEGTIVYEILARLRENIRRQVI
ncbi:MAG: alanine racemase [Candidatus Pacebacteria bacterium]|nr:alanine racemase [Candidatus Paceibacterota bacterium]